LSLYLSKIYIVVFLGGYKTLVGRRVSKLRMSFTLKLEVIYPLPPKLWYHLTRLYRITARKTLPVPCTGS